MVTLALRPLAVWNRHETLSRVAGKVWEIKVKESWSTMVDFSESFSELLATYAGLGTYDVEGHYYRGEECLGKDEVLSMCVSVCGVKQFSFDLQLV